jgi:molybdopterin converting factor small subunit
MMETGRAEDGPSRIHVRLFALARQRAGQATIVVEVPGPATVAALKRALADASPGLAPLVPHLLIAIEGEYASDDRTLIPQGAEVAAIPPVSGGCPTGFDRGFPHDPDH